MVGKRDLQGVAVPFYLGEGDVAAFALHTAAAPDVAGRQPVLIVPPFGFEDMCTYRARWAWAQHLAADGHHVLRLDLPGSGDSPGGPRDPDRVEAWTAAVDRAARWLAARGPYGTVTVLAIGLGGLVAARAAADGAPIDALALWAVPSSGRKLVRVLKAFSQLETAESGAQGESAPPGSLISGGYLLSAQTLDALKGLDVKKLDWATPPRHALLLGREQTPADQALHEALEAAGATVAEEQGIGFGLMTSEPHPSKPLPLEVFAAVDEWLERVEADAAASPSPPVAGTDAPTTTATTIVFDAGGEAAAGLRERPFSVPQPTGELSGVLSEPADPAALAAGAPCVVMLNAGAQRRTGPNRMWVEAARRWARQGVRTLRLDLSNIGESVEDGRAWEDVVGLTDPAYVAQVRETLDALEAQGLGSRFILMGLCSGAYWSFQVALEDPRVVSAFMLNPGVLVWSRARITGRQSRRLAKVLKPYAWRKVLRGDVPRRDLAQFVRQSSEYALITLREAPRALRARGEAPAGSEVERSLDALRDRGGRGLLLFTPGERLRQELEVEGVLTGFEERWPNVSLRLVDDAGDSHVLQSLSLQQATHGELDAALATELGRASGGAPGAPAMPATR